MGLTRGGGAPQVVSVAGLLRRLDRSVTTCWRLTSYCSEIGFVCQLDALVVSVEGGYRLFGRRPWFWKTGRRLGSISTLLGRRSSGGLGWRRP